VFCAEDCQRDGKAQVGQGYNLVDPTSLSDIVLRGQQANHEQREAGGGHQEGGAREVKKYGWNSCLHGLKFYDEVGFQTALAALAFAAARPVVRDLTVFRQ